MTFNKLIKVPNFKIYLMANEKNKEMHELHVTLEKEMFDRLEAIKDYHGIKNLTEIVRFLITKEYRQIKKSD